MGCLWEDKVWGWVEMHRKEFGWKDWWVDELMYFIILPSSFLSFSRTRESSGVAGDG